MKEKLTFSLFISACGFFFYTDKSRKVDFAFFIIKVEILVAGA